MENSLLEQQIADLERLIKEKKSSLEKVSSGAESLPSDKEILHEVIGEKIQEHAPTYIPKMQSNTTATPATDNIPSYMTPELKEKVQELINLAFTKNIGEAIKSATGNSALLDAFHDALVDELYDALIERKKVQEVK